MIIHWISWPDILPPWSTNIMFLEGGIYRNEGNYKDLYRVKITSAMWRDCLWLLLCLWTLFLWELGLYWPNRSIKTWTCREKQNQSKGRLWTLGICRITPRRCSRLETTHWCCWSNWHYWPMISLSTLLVNFWGEHLSSSLCFSCELQDNMLTEI